MTNAQIMAQCLDVSVEEIEASLEDGEPLAEVIDIADFNAALDKAREATRASCVNFIRALASVSVGYPVSDERAVLNNVAAMLEKS